MLGVAVLNPSLTQLLCASLESTAVIAVAQTGHYFLAQIIQFTSNIFVVVQSSVYAGLPYLCF